MCFVTERHIIVANAGDSRCVVCVDGKGYALSYDHTPEGMYEIERIKKAGGYIRDGRVNSKLNLTRALGDL